MYVQPVKDILSNRVSYHYRGMKLTCYKLLLECGHIVYRKYFRQTVVCSFCYRNEKQKTPPKKVFDNAGQEIFPFDEKTQTPI